MKFFSVTPLLFILFTLACSSEIPDRLESGFSMQQHSLAFANFAFGYQDSVMEAESMQRMFGASVCQPGSSPCALTVPARAFAARVNQVMGGGRCEGFAVLASLFEAGGAKVGDFGETNRARDLTLVDNPPLQRELAYWFSTQLLPTTTDATRAYMAKDVMPALAEALAPDASERVRVGIVRKNGAVVSGGHSLTPIGYHIDPADPGVYWLRLYDNNNPDFEREMKIDVARNRWEFWASVEPSDASRFYYGDATNNNPLYLAPVLSRTGTQDCFFCSGNDAQIVTAGGAQVTVETPEGEAGWIDGVLTEAGDTLVAPDFTIGLDDEPLRSIVHRRGSGTQSGTKLTIRAPFNPEHPGAQQSVDLMDRNSRVVASGLSVIGADQLRLGQGGGDIAYQNNSGTDISLLSEVATGDGGSISATAIIKGGSSEVSVHVDPESGEVSVGATGSQGSEVTMVVTHTDADGSETSGQLTFTSDGDGTVSADADALANGDPLTGTVDNNGVTSTVSNACEDGVRSGAETDVDCGAVCAQKCGIGQICVTGADCTSGYCHATDEVCVARSCDDGVRSGGESDVDCGGSDCGSCVTGRSCGSDGDCESLACVQSLCVGSYSIGFTVTGLPPADSLVLRNNGGDELEVSTNDSFTFATRVTGSYAVTVRQQPSTATCSVGRGRSVAVADVTDVTVDCVASYGVAGQLDGLADGASVTLQHGAEQLTLTQNGVFSFSTRTEGPYAVTVATQPAEQSCSVRNGSGTASADVTDVEVSCVDGYSIGGLLSGLPTGESVVLQNNGGDDLTVLADGAFSFASPTTSYLVTVLTQPTSANCTVRNGGGVATGPVNDVAVDCIGQATSALDPGFNSLGYYSEDHAVGAADFWYDALIEVDDSIVLCGQTQVAPGDSDWILSKITVDGALDASFGSNGHTTLSGGVGFETASRIFADPVGYIVVGTRINSAGRRVLALARFTTLGALDTSFGSNGVAELDNGLVTTSGGATYDLFGGGFYIVGRTTPTGGAPHDLVVVHVGADGALDPLFGSGGWLTWDNGGADDAGNSVAVAADISGDIFVSGVTDLSSVVLRYDSAGAPVASFGSGGAAIFDLSASFDEVPYRVVGDGAGVVVAGKASDGTTYNMVLARLTSSGVLDPSFGNGGVTSVDLAFADELRALIPAPMGGWYAAGSSDGDLVIVMVDSAGQLDPSFGSGGLFSDPLGGATQALSLALDSSLRLVVAGIITHTSQDLGVARVLP